MPWVRGRADRLTKLNREERFGWAAVVAALNEVGIMYRTCNPWTGKVLTHFVLSTADRETLQLCRQLRNKILHSDFRAARRELNELGPVVI